MLKILSVTMTEPHRVKCVLDKHDIFHAAIEVAKKHFKLDLHCPECAKEDRPLEAGDHSRVMDHSCRKMMELSMEECCNHLRESWSPVEILEKCEDVASNMDWCMKEVQTNFFNKQWLGQIVKCCRFFLVLSNKKCL